MLFRKFIRIFYIKPSLYENRISIQTVSKLKKHQWLRGLVSKRDLSQTMSSVLRFRVLLKDLSLKWTRSVLVSALVRRCRRDGVREVLQCFRQTILRPRRTLLLSATAACKSSQEKESGADESENNITDEELMALTSEMDKVEELMRTTLYCQECGKRLPIDKRQPGISYCSCKAGAPRASDDGWEPYLEAEDVVIWRRQYKGPGLYAYKMYGRYKDVCARDFANVQLDTVYRRVWDNAVASLQLIEEEVNGLKDQALLHWEVLWPRLFANRDYVYLRRHKEYSVTTKRCPQEQSIIRTLPQPAGHSTVVETPEERTSVHSRARRKIHEEDAKKRIEDAKVSKRNKLFVIVSKSCESEKAPETKHAIRVTEYWSQMIVRSLDGDDQPGMEFVLTYYDEPGVGGMPPGVASWAAGRAAPAYLGEMRRAASQHTHYLSTLDQTTSGETTDHTAMPSPMEYGERSTLLSEQDMESSKQGPDLDLETSESEKKSKTDTTTKSEDNNSTTSEPTTTNPDETTSTTSGPTNSDIFEATKESVTTKKSEETRVETVKVNSENSAEPKEKAEESEEPLEEEGEKNGSWWSYLYPFYYFV